GKTELAGCGRQGNRSGTLLQEIGQPVDCSQIRLLNDARLAVDAGALDDVIIEFVAFLLADEGRHNRVIHYWYPKLVVNNNQRISPTSTLFCTISGKSSPSLFS